MYVLGDLTLVNESIDVMWDHRVSFLRCSGFATSPSGKAKKHGKEVARYKEHDALLDVAAVVVALRQYGGTPPNERTKERANERTKDHEPAHEAYQNGSKIEPKRTNFGAKTDPKSLPSTPRRQFSSPIAPSVSQIEPASALLVAQVARISKLVSVLRQFRY